VRFRNRAAAGRRLAEDLQDYAKPGVIVLGLPRGGVPVAAEVASKIGAPMDVFLVRKLGVPGHPELAMGAIANGDVTVLNEDVVQDLRIGAEAIEEVAARERQELDRRDLAYRGTRHPPVLRERTVILVDDGLATGSTMEAAVRAVRQQGPSELVVAVPVGSRDACERLKKVADRVVCAATPEPFDAVGLWYDDFSQTPDDEVARLLAAQ
jgi:predicted phosphoribosyltransferase